MDIVAILEAWGRHPLVNWAPNGFPDEAAFVRMMHERVTVVPGKDEKAPPAPLPEELYLMVDEAMSALRPRNRRRYWALCMVYRFGFRDHQVAEKIGTTRQMAQRIRKEAEAWIEGRLDLELVA